MNGLQLTTLLAGCPMDKLAMAAFFVGDGAQLADISEVATDRTKIFLISTWEGPAMTIVDVISAIQDIRLKVFHTELPVYGVMPFEDPVPSGEITGIATNGPKVIQFHVGVVPPL